MKKLAAAALALAVASASSIAFAQTVTSGTQSAATQSSSVNNQVVLQSGGTSTDNVDYRGSYTVKSAPTLYAPGLTASITETCWGSVSAGVSVVGVGVSGGATIKDLDCNKRLNAAVAWRMERKDIAFNIMCQEDDFREAAALTDKPCGSIAAKTASASLPVAELAVEKPQYTDPFVRQRLGLPPLSK